jgi:hypothetical protein
MEYQNDPEVIDLVSDSYSSSTSNDSATSDTSSTPLNTCHLLYDDHSTCDNTAIPCAATTSHHTATSSATYLSLPLFGVEYVPHEEFVLLAEVMDNPYGKRIASTANFTPAKRHATMSCTPEIEGHHHDTGPTYRDIAQELDDLLHASQQQSLQSTLSPAFHTTDEIHQIIDNIILSLPFTQSDAA